VSRTRRITTRMSGARTIVAVAAAGLALTGCGSAHPGVAVEVGDEEIPVSRVDSAAANMCTALSEQFEAEGSTVPMGFVRQGVIQLLTLRSQAEQIAEEYGVEPGSTYGNDVAQRQKTAASMPEDVRADYVELTSANALAQDVLEQVGRMELEERGITEPTVEQVSQAGVDVFTVWPDANGVEIDPRYGLENVDGALTPVDTNLSVAVSDEAKAGMSTEPDAAYARTLPLTHRCG
jgi:hypothetical protein